jgi:hypothetical protein
MVKESINKITREPRRVGGSSILSHYAQVDDIAIDLIFFNSMDKIFYGPFVYDLL